jgi:hypothetical protein
MGAFAAFGWVDMAAWFPTFAKNAKMGHPSARRNLNDFYKSVIENCTNCMAICSAYFLTHSLACNVRVTSDTTASPPSIVAVSLSAFPAVPIWQ